MRTPRGVGPVVVAGLMAGSLAAACGSSSSSGLNNPATLASTVKSSTQHELNSAAAGEPPGTTVTSVSCVGQRQSRFTCNVHLSNGQVRTLGVMVHPGGTAYTVTSGAF